VVSQDSMAVYPYDDKERKHAPGVTSLSKNDNMFLEKVSQSWNWDIRLETFGIIRDPRTNS